MSGMSAPVWDGPLNKEDVHLSPSKKHNCWVFWLVNDLRPDIFGKERVKSDSDSTRSARTQRTSADGKSHEAIHEPSPSQTHLQPPLCYSQLPRYQRTFEDQILTPPTAPDFLEDDFCLEPGLEWKFPAAGLAKNCSSRSIQDFHSLNKENRASLLRIFLSDPDSNGKSTDLGMWKDDPDIPSFRKP